MLTRADFLSLNFVKKEDYTGSYKGLRYMLHQEFLDEEKKEKKLKVYIWPEPYSFLATEDEKKEDKLFEFSEDGLADAISWMNERYEEVRLKD